MCEKVSQEYKPGVMILGKVMRLCVMGSGSAESLSDPQTPNPTPQTKPQTEGANNCVVGGGWWSESV